LIHEADNLNLQLRRSPCCTIPIKVCRCRSLRRRGNTNRFRTISGEFPGNQFPVETDLATYRGRMTIIMGIARCHREVPCLCRLNVLC
jgi:hypothetical protein